jgi:O-methyltransferase
MNLRTYSSYLLRKLLFYTPLKRFLFPRYYSSFSPHQLCILVQLLEESLNVRGTILEIGCYIGSTTIFLNKHLQYRQIQRTYYALDTFSGFTKRDIDFEVTVRNKNRGELDECLFNLNSLTWFKYTLALNNIRNVIPIKSDILQYNLESLNQKFAFVLIDVDFYSPVKSALNKVWPLMNPDGIIIVDDCLPNALFDGAHLAYTEFIESQKLLPEIVGDKMGIIRVKQKADDIKRTK